MKKHLRISILILSLTVLLSLISGCEIFIGNEDEGEFTANEGLVIPKVTPDVTAEPTTEVLNGSLAEYVEPDKETAVHATINVKNYGAIKLELYTNIAPITVENFVNLAKDSFYDGLTFHRVISGFVIQGGDPKGDGTGGSGQNITGEFSANGIANSLSHKRGVISMARNSYDMDSASSQFFICHQDNPESLDGQYAAFGIVTEGMDVVDAIASVATDENDKPVTDVIIESITIDS